jgi:hypothetical protein
MDKNGLTLLLNALEQFSAQIKRAIGDPDKKAGKDKGVDAYVPLPPRRGRARTIDREAVIADAITGQFTQKHLATRHNCSVVSICNILREYRGLNPSPDTHRAHVLPTQYRGQRIV